MNRADTGLLLAASATGSPQNAAPRRIRMDGFEMFRRIHMAVRYLRLRTRWTAHPDRDEWHRGAWLIEGGEANYGLFHPHRQTTRHLTLMAAMETAERADSVQFVFRSRQGDVRDTAAAMIPPEED